MQQKIVLVGGPGTGKTSVLEELQRRGFSCQVEVSRAVTKRAQEDGIEQLFLSQPLLFSEKLLEGRINQYKEAQNTKEKLVFFDRGIPEVFAYMNYLNTKYPTYFIKKSKEYIYDKVFYFSPWKDIYKSDNERYETFEASLEISNHIKDAYIEIGYQLHEVPFESIENRANYILQQVEADL